MVASGLGFRVCGLVGRETSGTRRELRFFGEMEAVCHAFEGSGVPDFV
jgi:hypothetical protein